MGRSERYVILDWAQLTQNLGKSRVDCKGANWSVFWPNHFYPNRFGPCLSFWTCWLVEFLRIASMDQIQIRVLCPIAPVKKPWRMQAYITSRCIFSTTIWQILSKTHFNEDMKNLVGLSKNRCYKNVGVTHLLKSKLQKVLFLI